MVLSLEVGQLLFMKDETDGWIPATVTSTKGLGVEMTAALLLSDGSTKEVTNADAGELQRGDVTSMTGVEDMVKMDVLTVGSVLQNLRTRYAKKEIYTAVGSILAAINPFELIPSLYSHERMELYANMATDEEPPPHPYALMELAYRGLLANNQSQSILISGESGAGKTETTKYILSYLSFRSTSVEAERRSLEPDYENLVRRNSIGGKFSVEDSVVMSNPVMEAFANAKTTRNHNSSRFGKYVQVSLQSTGVVTGGRVTTYLLEKTRVARQLPGERSYHVFYQLCRGADDALRAQLGLPHEPSEFSSLNDGGCVDIKGVEDGDMFRQTKICMESIGLLPESQNEVFQVVAAVLHLMNVDFDPVDIPGQDIGSQVAPGNAGGPIGNGESSLQWASKLLGLEPEQLEEALIARQINPGIGGSADMVIVPSSPKVASQARDAVAKALYSALFDWLVEKINLTLTAAMGTRLDKEGNRFIGLLDIFGFEAFGTNSLEQLLINYANERLQQQFNAFVFKLEEKEFAVEGLSKVYVEHCRVEFVDNDDVLKLLESRPNGILSLLKEESTLKTGSGVSLGRRYRTVFGKNPRFNIPRIRGGQKGSDNLFGIIHFAGEVYYDSTEFVEKNRDEVPPTLRELVLSSNYQFVANLLKDFAGDAAEEPGRGRRRGSTRRGSESKGHRLKGTVLVTGKFVGSLTSLMAAIGETEPHYIRCIKPNEKQLPMIFEGAYILEQLNWMGMVQIVDIRQRGFSVRYPYEEFITKYGKVAGRPVADPALVIPAHGEGNQRRRDSSGSGLSREVFAPPAEGIGGGLVVKAPNPWREEAEKVTAALVHQGHMEVGKFHLGMTKIFLRTSTQRKLDAAREEHIRGEAVAMLDDAIEKRDMEGLNKALDLAMQIRLRSEKIGEAKIVILELKREEALAEVTEAMEADNFDRLLKCIQAASAIGVPDSELEPARQQCQDITLRKELLSRLRKASTSAELCLGHAGDTTPHFEALDPLLEEAEQMGGKILQDKEIARARGLRHELKMAQEEPVLEAMERAMAEPRPDVGTLRTLVAMATDEISIEIGMDTLERCRQTLREAEARDEAEVKEREATSAAAAAASITAAFRGEGMAPEGGEDADMEGSVRGAEVGGVTEGEKARMLEEQVRFQKEKALAEAEASAAAAEANAIGMVARARSMRAITAAAVRKSRTPVDPFSKAEEMSLSVPSNIEESLRREVESPGQTGGARRKSVLLESLETLVLDPTVSRRRSSSEGIRGIAAAVAKAVEEEEEDKNSQPGREKYPFRYIPLYVANIRLSHHTCLHMSDEDIIKALKEGSLMQKVSHAKFGKKKKNIKWVRLSEDLSKLVWMDEEKRDKKGIPLTAKTATLKRGSHAVKSITIGLQSQALIKEWDVAPSWVRLPSEWCYFSLHTSSNTYDFGSMDAGTVLLWAVGLTLVLGSSVVEKPPLSQAQRLFTRSTDQVSREEPIPLCPMMWPIARQVASVANDLGINHPKYRHQWWSAVELLESPLPEGFARIVQEDGTMAYSWPATDTSPSRIGKHPRLEEFKQKIDYNSVLSVSPGVEARTANRKSVNSLTKLHPVRCFACCYRGDLVSIRRFVAEGGKIDSPYLESYERHWNKAMGGDDYSWAEPGLGTTPLNYTLAFCDIIGLHSAAEVVSVLLELGADVNRDDGDPGVRYTPLHSAIANESPSLVRMVIQQGAGVNKPRKDGRIPLHTAMRLPGGQHKLSIMGMLLVVGASIDAREPFQGNTPLHMACSMGDLDSVELLLKAGADATMKNGGQHTPSELTRLEIAHLEDYMDQLREGSSSSSNLTSPDSQHKSTSGMFSSESGSRFPVDAGAELSRSESKLQRMESIAEVLKEWQLRYDEAPYDDEPLSPTLSPS